MGAQVFYRGEMMGSAKSAIGHDVWDSALFVSSDASQARSYAGDAGVITNIVPKADARILYEGTTEFRMITGRGNLTPMETARVAEANGYDALWFKQQGNLGTLIFDRTKFDGCEQLINQHSGRRPLAEFNGENLMLARQQGYDVSTRFFHGTNIEFDNFDLAKTGSNTKYNNAKGCLYLTKSTMLATNYAEGAVFRNGGIPIVMEVVIAIKRPLIIDRATEFYRLKDKLSDGGLRRHLILSGFDSAIVNGGEEVCILDPSVVRKVSHLFNVEVNGDEQVRDIAIRDNARAVARAVVFSIDNVWQTATVDDLREEVAIVLGGMAPDLNCEKVIEDILGYSRDEMRNSIEELAFGQLRLLSMFNGDSEKNMIMAPGADDRLFVPSSRTQIKF
jgi:hypothetical protein